MATELSTVEMQVPGLCCLECSQGVEAALRRTPGVHDLRVQGFAEKVVITYDAAATEPMKLAQVMADAGHPATRGPGANAPFGQTRGSSPHPQPNQSRYALAFAVLRLAFVGVVSLIALIEIVGESTSVAAVLPFFTCSEKGEQSSDKLIYHQK